MDEYREDCLRKAADALAEAISQLDSASGPSFQREYAFPSEDITRLLEALQKLKVAQIEMAIVARRHNV